ncbi:protein kinase [Mediterranea sp. An20]|uniref:type II toxin-antitoxin system HipA family toxin n=1 Tax=Bacteroidaceae TaxID=815 RepID=UPI000B3A9EBC|nr:MULTISPECIES: type II toxin-antitoxin system HipA family toxin [Bacteroidaceae]MCL1616999.1 type II toxin-antitoxin system HipA family toxin [Bacteroides sp. ET71]OUP11546.1 protein kinase [Mediterranea sp. An20]
MIRNLDVFLWGRKVGSLVAYKERYTEKHCFYFDRDFLGSGYDIAPLRASIHSVSVRNGLPVYGEDGKLFGGLPSFIADSLPDHWGNKVFNEWAKTRGISARNLSVLDRLAYIGRRGMGALEFLPPAAEDMEEPFKVEIADLYRLAQSALDEARNFRAEIQPDFLIESLFKVGTSAGGRRPKAIINLNPETGECYSGQVAAPAPGYVPMIIKFDEHSDIPTTRIEYSYYLMAKDAGLNMMPSRLMEGGQAAHFLTERFDRREGKKVHVQTLAAMNPDADSYESLFDTACRIGILPAELKQLFLLTVMNVIGGNVDDHNKNFSFLMEDDGVWHTAPAYDFTFSVDPSAPGYVNRHSMTVCNRNCDIGRGDLLELAKRYNIKGADALIEKAVGVVSRYEDYARQAGIDGYWLQKIKEETAYRIENMRETTRN